VRDARAALERAARDGSNIMPPSIRCAHAGVTTGEWAGTLRGVFGEYRAPTGVGNAKATRFELLAPARERVEQARRILGRRPKILIGKPGLDGHSNGAEQIAVAARDSGMEVVYEGIRLTPARIVNSALEEGVHLIGLSILSGSHIELVHDVLDRMKAEALDDIPLVVGGIIPAQDALDLQNAGVARVFTPKDFDLPGMMTEMIELMLHAQRAGEGTSPSV
jgi:(2R)-ethylmalonyl-CoA mutase